MDPVQVPSRWCRSCSSTGEEVGGEVQQSGGGTSCRFNTPSINRVRVLGGDYGGCSEPLIRALAPTVPLYSAARWGPTNLGLVGRPQSGYWIKARLDRCAESDEINTNNLPLDLTSYLNFGLNLNT